MKGLVLTTQNAGRDVPRWQSHIGRNLVKLERTSIAFETQY